MMKNRLESRTNNYSMPNCGGVLISAAKVIKVILILWALVSAAGIGVAIGSVSETGGIIAGIIWLIPGIILAIILGDMLQGYGEIVKYTALTAGALTCLCEKSNIHFQHSSEHAGSDTEPDSKKKSASENKSVSRKQIIIEENYEKKTDGTVVVDEEGVHFHGVRGAKVTCPFCGKVQTKGIEYCTGCDAKFFFDE